MKMQLKSLNWILWLLLGLLLFLLSYFSFKIFNNCIYVWVIILFLAFCYFLVTGIKTNIIKFKILLFNFSAILFALFLVEGYLWLMDSASFNEDPEELTGTWTQGYAVHPYLGYGSNGDGIFTYKKIKKNKVIYNVSYTIKNGLRFTPNSNEESENCVLFFGCSYTFGSGLSDSSTLPYFFNKCANEKYKLLNYGLEGYGPHQMLALIENRVTKDIQNCKYEKIAIYNFITTHISRAAGYAVWDQLGPNYEIIEGHLMKTGSFRKLPDRIAERIEKSHIYKKLFFDRKPKRNDVMRTIAIINKAKELLLSQNVNLFVFIWDEVTGIEKDFPSENDYHFFLDEMKRNRIQTFFVHDAINDFDENESAYSFQYDGHPNELANYKIADYLYTQIKNSNLKIEEQ